MTKDSNNTLQAFSTVTYLTELQKISIPEDFHTLTGNLPYRLTNDAMFHLAWEANPHALKALLCSLLSYDSADIDSIEVTNPLEIGTYIEDKNFVLDTRLHLNHNSLVNIEMQVVNLSFWKERSLGYLCRTFDNLNKGENYSNTKPAIHIGILDFEIFPDDTEFYASYHLANDKTHKIYSDKFQLFVLQLNQTEHATPENISSGIHVWAQLFKATTWKEVFALAEQNPVIMDIAKTMYQASADERTRNLLHGRELGERTHNTLTCMLSDAQSELANAKSELSDAQSELANAKSELSDAHAEIARLTALLAAKEAQAN